MRCLAPALIECARKEHRQGRCTVRSVAAVLGVTEDQAQALILAPDGQPLADVVEWIIADSRGSLIPLGHTAA